MSTQANTVFYSTWTCTLLPNSQLFMYPMDSDAFLYNNLHTIGYSSQLRSPWSMMTRTRADTVLYMYFYLYYYGRAPGCNS